MYMTMCEHLEALDRELKEKRIKETFRGQAWSENSREWAYYNCVLDIKKIKLRYNFPSFVTIHVNDDSRSGLEAGFVCEQCKDAIMGIHPSLQQGKIVVS
jgi:hypothetical protein